MTARRIAERLVRTVCALVLGAVAVACAGSDAPASLVVDIPGRSMTKLPFVMAYDQGLYEKHGLAVELRLEESDVAGAINTRATLLQRLLGSLEFTGTTEADIVVEGHGPTIIRMTEGENMPQWVSLAATDCTYSSSIGVRAGIESLEALRGKRVGVNWDHTNSGISAAALFRHMGWARGVDVELVEMMEHDGIEELMAGNVDAVVGGNRRLPQVSPETYRVVDMPLLEGSLSGNSVMVPPGWLDQGNNRDAARRFLMAAVEGLALYHERPEVAVEVMTRWYGTAEDDARARYSEDEALPRKPYPCVAGITTVMELFDSPGMSRFVAEDFYDASLIRELDESGFIDRAYAEYGALNRPAR